MSNYKVSIEELLLLIDEFFFVWKFPYITQEFKNVYSRLTVIDVDGFKTSTSYKELKAKSKRPFDTHLSRFGKRVQALNKWKTECELKHANKYDYSLINPEKYKLLCEKLPIICPTHGKFMQQGNIHIRGNGCPKCSLRSISLGQLQWLLWIEETKNIKLQHFLNRGEYLIPNTKFRVDGIDHNSNTIYEFYGDAYHGNPSIYPPKDFCSPRNKYKTAEQLWAETKHREQTLKTNYKLVTIWESEWNMLLKEQKVVLSKKIHQKIYDHLQNGIGIKVNKTLLQHGVELINPNMFNWHDYAEFRCLICNKQQSYRAYKKIEHLRKTNQRCLLNCK